MPDNPNSASIKTRFAPSPTGYLHVGGARTALFNYVFARKLGGEFLLRVEDTDISRSEKEKVDQIITDLKWLGINWDEEIIYQSKRISLYQDYTKHLLESYKAYRCFCTPQELEAKRRIEDKSERAYLYDGKCRHLSEDEIRANLDKGMSYVIRFRVPEGSTNWVDSVHDKISVNNQEIEDFVLLRSDGSPTYQIAVVTDDHEMEISHVIRGDDHIPNTPKQILLYRAFGWQVPQFSHVPLILGADGKRLSKRHGATAVGEFRDKGYLPQALLNYLFLLGWSPGDDSEIMTLEEITKKFSLKGISKKGAIFDETKLIWMNGNYIREMPDEEILPYVIDYLKTRKFNAGDASNSDYLLSVIRLMKPRVEVLPDFIDSARYFFEDPADYDPKAVNKYLKNADIWIYLSEFIEQLDALSEYDQTNIENLLRAIAEERNISAAKIIHPVRLALTGKTASPGLFEMMEIIGKEAVLRRLNSLLSQKEEIMQRIDLQA